MSRRLLLVAVVGTSATALYVAGPAVAASILLMCGWMREHALRSGAEGRLRTAGRELETRALLEHLAAVAAGTDDGGTTARARPTRH